MRKLLLALVALFIALPARAFCGFYVSDSNSKLFNNATQVALMREGTRTVLAMQNDYEGPPERFALVVPVPVVLQKENVKTLPRDLFTKLEQLDAPRLVEYWEQDPCAQGGGGTGEGFGNGHGRMGGAHASRSAAPDLGVTVEAQFTVGEYEIVILSAEDSGGLDTWLRREKYNIPAGAEPFLRPYVAAGSKFFVAKVDPAKVVFDDRHQAALSPLRFHYDSEQFTLPVRLGLLNAKDTQDLIIHILAKGQRYEAANYENVAIPTNLDVNDDAKKDFAGVYNALFDDTVHAHPKSVVTEYSWDAATCDPCPGPALSGQDLATLGADALPSQQAQTQQPIGPRRTWRRGGGFVLTRLHARYTKDALGDDLVFRAAPPIVGGREMRAFGTTLEQTPSPSSFNNFQARYAIRHPWTGEIKCEHPVRDVWGGPPGGHSYEPPSAATKLAFSDRSANKLNSFVSYKTQPTATTTAPPPTPSTSSTPSPTPPAAKSGCSCDVAGIPIPIPIPGSTFSLFMLGAWILRRRRP
jgi:hypothetical protein